MVSRKQSDRNMRGLLENVELGGWTVEDPVGKSNIYARRRRRRPAGSSGIWAVR